MELGCSRHLKLPCSLHPIGISKHGNTLSELLIYFPAIPKITYAILAVLLTVYYYIYLCSITWFVFVRCPQTGDLAAASIVFSLGVSSEIGAIKLFIIAKLRDITGEYLQCEADMAPGRLRARVGRSLRTVRRRAFVYWLVLVVNAFAYDLMPAFLPGRHLSEDVFVIYGFEPMFESPNFEIASTLMGVSVVFICYTAGSISAFLIVIVGYSEATMLALSDEISCVWDDACASECQQPNDFIRARLGKIVAIHTKQIRLIREVEVVFRGALAGGFACVAFGLIAALLGGLENTFLQLPFCVIQISVDCFVGQRLRDANVAFETAVYNCKWEYFDKSNMKTVLLILQNSQKTMGLTAGGVAALDFTSLMTIFKSVYSGVHHSQTDD
ncbi:olfactory receptor 37 [Bombyx mori]|uniref:Odorant receptor n=1 Tax=Bombyx mori TaxID=7091 RepID=A7E3H8_BOMMO|nr:olfactory receptor 37 [Bombyx mori]DAA05993.1 TPA_exp: odorant receptor 37 [Bombyx mori]